MTVFCFCSGGLSIWEVRRCHRRSSVQVSRCRSVKCVQGERKQKPLEEKRKPLEEKRKPLEGRARSSKAVRHYVNLTNGIEVLHSLTKFVPPDEIRFMRMQSSHAEASAYEKILSEIDHDLLWSLASGYTCYMYDFASRNPKRGVSRSQFLGCEFVKWALAYLWFGRESALLPKTVSVRGKNVVPYWLDEVLPYKIGKDTKKRIRYYTPFCAANGVSQIDLRAIYGRASVLDGKKEAHVALASKWQNSSYPRQLDRDPAVGMESWMEDNRLAEFDPETDANELRQIQQWMVAGSTSTSGAVSLGDSDATHI